MILSEKNRLLYFISKYMKIFANDSQIHVLELYKTKMSLQWSH